MTPSHYQQAFYEALTGDDDDLQLQAVAGSGKTSSLQEGVNRLDWAVQCGTLMTAFNQHIKQELERRQIAGGIPDGVTISTIHGLGYQALRRAYQPQDARNWVDAKKYDRLNAWWWQRQGIHTGRGADPEAQLAAAAVPKLVRLAMLTLAEPEEADLLGLVNRYGIDLPESREARAFDAVADLLDWGRRGMAQPDLAGNTYHPQERIGFEDMIWLPLVEDIPLPQYDLIMVDEAQDLSRSQQELLLRTRGDGGRMVWTGDPNQSVYSFAGADSESFDRIRDLTDARRMPLSICYRCARSIVARARELVPEIEPWERSPEGLVREDVTTMDLIDMACDAYAGSSRESLMILCRVNAPLVSAALWLIRRGVPAKVRGRDIGQQLEATLKQIERIEGFRFDLLEQSAWAYLARERNALSAREGGEMQIAALEDRVESVLAVWQAALKNGAHSLAGMRERIRDLFSDDERTVILSSIHKAKGLEADRVGILRGDLLPHPAARQLWQLEQEHNLQYVAVTRARRELMICPQ